mgnify:CR=1 FL=1
MTLSQSDIVRALSDFNDVNLNASDKFLRYVTDILNSIQKIQKSVYEGSWNLTVGKVDSLVDSGADLKAIVRELTQPPKSGPLLPVGMTNNLLQYDLGDFTAISGKKLVAIDGGYSLIDQQHIDRQLIDCLQSLLTPETDCVIEFGAGWGRNLANLLLSSENTDVTYMACEQSESGRYCFDRILGTTDGICHESHVFDFYAPDFSMLDGRKHILAFTCAAIEQVALLPVSFMEGIFQAADKVTLVFYEPIGWQRFTNHAQFAITRLLQEIGDLVSDEDMHQRNYQYVFKNENFHDNSASWSLGCRYNVNLLRLIKSLTDENPDRLVSVRYDVFGENPLNPYSLIVLSNDERPSH